MEQDPIVAKLAAEFTRAAAPCGYHPFGYHLYGKGPCSMFETQWRHGSGFHLQRVPHCLSLAMGLTWTMRYITTLYVLWSTRNKRAKTLTFKF